MRCGAASEKRVLLWMCLLIAVNQLGFGAVIPVLPLYARSFGVSASAIGMAVACYGLARVVVAMPTGHLADSVGRRPTLALGGVLSAAGNLWCAVAPDYAHFLVARFVAGAGAGLVVTAGAVVLADITSPARRGRVMAVYQGVFLFAVGIGPFPGGLLAERFGLAAPFTAYAVLGGLVAVVAWYAVPETRGASVPAGAGERSRPPSFSLQLARMLRHGGFVLVGLISFMNAVARTGGLFVIVPVLGAVSLGLRPDQIGLGMALGSVVGLLVTYPAGALVDRYGRKAVIVPATLGAGASLGLFCVAPSLAWFVAACIAWGAASAAGGAAPAAYAADTAPSGMNAAAMSGFRLLGDLGYVVGPLLLGAAMDVFGARGPLLGAAIALALTGLVFAWLAPESYRPR